MRSNRFELDDPVIGLAWSPDNRRVAVAGISGPCAIVEVATGLATRRLAGHKDGTLALSWSARGDVIATGGQDASVKLWSADSGALLRELDGGSAWVEQVAFAPDGVRLASAAGKRLRLWDAEGGLQFEFPTHESTVAALQWRADGHEVATACYGKIRCFRVGEKRPHQTLEWKSSLISLAWSSNGRFLAAGTQENSIEFYRLPASGRAPLHMSGYPAKVRHLAWDSTGRALAANAGDVVTVWNVSGKGPAGTIPLQLAAHPAAVSALAYQQRGSLLATGCEAGVVVLWDPAQCPWPVGEPCPTDKHLLAVKIGSAINQLRWSPGETVVGIGSQGGTVAFQPWPGPRRT